MARISKRQLRLQFLLAFQVWYSIGVELYRGIVLYRSNCPHGHFLVFLSLFSHPDTLIAYGPTAHLSRLASTAYNATSIELGEDVPFYLHTEALTAH